VSFEPVKPFIEIPTATDFDKEGIYILGIPYDGTTSFRPGTRFGPDALREASYGLETYSPYLDKDTTEKAIFDIGNIPQQTSRGDLLRESFFSLTKNFDLKKHKLLTIGGEHSISFMPATHYLKEYGNLTVLHLDAHTDLRDSYLDDEFSHASVVKRIVDMIGEDQNLIQYGIRSGLKKEFTWMKENKTVANSLDELLERLEAMLTGPIYLTLDLDFFDPAYLPGTGTPEAGGEDFHNFMKIVKVLNSKNLVGADVVELSPGLDVSGNSSCFASKVVRELLLCISN
jgi:agmatinase